MSRARIGQPISVTLTPAQLAAIKALVVSGEPLTATIRMVISAGLAALAKRR
jgi:hypothetical protein